MNTAKAARVAILMSLSVALVMVSAEAQSPSAGPTTSAPVGQIPEKVPPNWKANGWDQSSWTAFREHCRAIFAHPGKFSHHEWVTCANVSVAFSLLPEPSMTPSLPPLAAASGSPTPLPTPLPPAPPVGSQSSGAATSGPPTVGANFTGGGGSACPGPLVMVSAHAQSPSAGPTTRAAGGIPEKAPPGWDQAAWTAIRENCERNLREMGRRAQLTAAQRSLLPPLNFSHGDMMLCAHLSVRPQTSLQPSALAPPEAGVAPTPMPTP
jgi:hypothetical protein